VSVKGDEGEAQFIKFVADIDEQVLHLLVNVAADACLLAVFIKGRFDDVRLIISGQVIISHKLANDGVGVDINGEALGIVFFGVVNLHIDNIFSRSYFQETVQALVVSLNILTIIELSLNILTIIELISAEFALLTFFALLGHEIFDWLVTLLPIGVDDS